MHLSYQNKKKKAELQNLTIWRVNVQVKLTPIPPDPWGMVKRLRKDRAERKTERRRRDG